MPDNIRLDHVPGSCIVFRNFRGRATPVTKEGDRNFCLIISNRLIRDQLAARGCNIKKLKNKAIIDGEKLNDIEFVNVAVRITPYKDEAENVDNIWGALDAQTIDQASLEFSFYEYNINGKKGTRIYLKNARFNIHDPFEQSIIDICWPGTVKYTINNTNNTEETNMEKIMSVEEIVSRFGVLEYVYNSCKSEDKKALKDIMEAVRAAKYYLIPRSADRCERLDRSTPINKSIVEADFDPKMAASIKQVIFNDPATVVVWFDDVKTVVKCQEGDTFDKEKGLAMAICKRLYGNESNFNNLIKKWTEPNVKKAVKEAIKKVESNKTAKGKSKDGKKKALDKARKNDKTMVVLTEAYRTKLRVKMAAKGWTYAQVAEKAGLGKSTVTRLISTAKQKHMPNKIRRDVFNKLNNALGIRWKG